MIEDAIQEVIKHWLIDWHTPYDLASGTNKSVDKKKKEATKQKVQELDEKRRKEVEEKVRVEAEHVVKQQAEQEEHDSERSGKSPFLQIEEEEDSEQGDGGQEEQRNPLRIKRYREQGKEGMRKKSKVSNPSPDPITLIDGDLDEIGDKVHDTTIKLLQQFK